MKILVTGGAGFIGSNLVERLLQREDVELVRVLDNLSTGSLTNVESFQSNPRFEFVQGDIRDARLLALPFTLPSYDVNQYWHERYHQEPGHVWLRQTIFDSFLDMPLPG